MMHIPLQYFLVLAFIYVEVGTASFTCGFLWLVGSLGCVKLKILIRLPWKERLEGYSIMDIYQCTKALCVINDLATTQEKNRLFYSTIRRCQRKVYIIEPVKSRLVQWWMIKDASAVGHGWLLFFMTSRYTYCFVFRKQSRSVASSRQSSMGIQQ